MAKTKHPVDVDFGKNLQFLMGQHPELGTQTKISKLLGVSQSTVGRMLRGEVAPSFDALHALSQEFDVQPRDFFIPHEQFTALASSDQRVGLPSHEDRISRSFDPRAKGLIPLISWKQARGEQIKFSDVTKWVMCPIEHSDSAFALDVKGLGMHNPAGPLSFKDGDRIYVDPKLPPQHLSLVIARQGDNEEVIFRQLVAEADKWMFLQLNPIWPNRVQQVLSSDALVGTVIGKLETYT